MSQESVSAQNADLDDVGLVGAGDVGQWFVAKLARAGFDPVVYDADPDAVAAAVDAGAHAADSAAALADRVDVVVLLLPTRDAVVAFYRAMNRPQEEWRRLAHHERDEE